MESQYQAGKCNIGKTEVKFRRNVYGYGGALVSFALFTILVFLNFPIVGYISLIIPVFASVHGFLEAKRSFCTAYGLSGRYNMVGELGQTQDVLSRTKRELDKSASIQIIKQAIFVSLLITIFLAASSKIIEPILTL